MAEQAASATSQLAATDPHSGQAPAAPTASDAATPPPGTPPGTPGKKRSPRGRRAGVRHRKATSTSSMKPDASRTPSSSDSNAGSAAPIQAAGATSTSPADSTSTSRAASPHAGLANRTALASAAAADAAQVLARHAQLMAQAAVAPTPATRVPYPVVPGSVEFVGVGAHGSFYPGDAQLGHLHQHNHRQSSTDPYVRAAAEAGYRMQQPQATSYATPAPEALYARRGAASSPLQLQSPTPRAQQRDGYGTLVSPIVPANMGGGAAGDSYGPLYSPEVGSPTTPGSGGYASTSTGRPKPPKVFVSYLPPTFTMDDVARLFAPHGTIVSIKLLPTPNESLLPLKYRCGFIQFTSEASVESAINALHGHHVACDGKRFILTVRNASDQAPCNTTNVLIKGLPTDVSERRVYDAFSRFGRVTSVRIIRDRSQHDEEMGMHGGGGAPRGSSAASAAARITSNKDKGLAFVNFLHSRDAMKAINAMHGAMLDGRRMHVSFAEKSYPYGVHVFDSDPLNNDGASAKPNTKTSGTAAPAPAPEQIIGSPAVQGLRGPPSTPAVGAPAYASPSVALHSAASRLAHAPAGGAYHASPEALMAHHRHSYMLAAQQHQQQQQQQQYEHEYEQQHGFAPGDMFDNEYEDAQFPAWSPALPLGPQRAGSFDPFAADPSRLLQSPLHLAPVAAPAGTLWNTDAGLPPPLPGLGGFPPTPYATPYMEPIAHPPHRAARLQKSTLLILNVPAHVAEDHVRYVLSQFGALLDCRLAAAQDTGTAVVKFEHGEDALAAAQAELELGGAPVAIAFAPSNDVEQVLASLDRQQQQAKRQASTPNLRAALFNAPEFRPNPKMATPATTPAAATLAMSRPHLTVSPLVSATSVAEQHAASAPLPQQPSPPVTPITPSTLAAAPFSPLFPLPAAGVFGGSFNSTHLRQSLTQSPTMLSFAHQSPSLSAASSSAGLMPARTRAFSNTSLGSASPWEPQLMMAPVGLAAATSAATCIAPAAAGELAGPSPTVARHRVTSFSSDSRDSTAAADLARGFAGMKLTLGGAQAMGGRTLPTTATGAAARTSDGPAESLVADLLTLVEHD